MHITLLSFTGKDRKDRKSSVRNRLLISALIIALLVDIAGIVFFILFLTQSGKLHKVQKEKQVMADSLAALRNHQAFTVDKPLELPERHTFISKLDGVHDLYALAPPMVFDGSKDLTLVIYLHGMGSNDLEPFVSPKQSPIAQNIQSHYPAAIVASPNYRATTSWANKAAIADIDQNIHELMERYPVSRIVIMGTSMGGCSALAYSYLAAEDIKAKIAGVVACEGAGDWLALYRKTPSRLVKTGMIIGLGGPAETVPNMYQERSINNNLEKIRPGTKFALISANQDTVIPPAFQKALEEKLKEANLPTKLIEVPDKHGVPASEFYLEGLNFVLGK
jgi:acetyl esterase/lipase